MRKLGMMGGGGSRSRRPRTCPTRGRNGSGYIGLAEVEAMENKFGLPMVLSSEGTVEVPDVAVVDRTDNIPDLAFVDAGVVEPVKKQMRIVGTIQETLDQRDGPTFCSYEIRNHFEAPLGAQGANIWRNPCSSCRHSLRGLRPH